MDTVASLGSSHVFIAIVISLLAVVLPLILTRVLMKRI